MMDRVDALRGILEKEGIGAALITSRENRFYLSGFTGSAGMLFVSADRAMLLTDSRYTIQARDEAKDFEVEITRTPIRRVRELLSQSGVSRLGFEDNDVTYRLYKELSEGAAYEFVPISRPLEGLRQQKSPAEIGAIKQAAAIADEAFSYIIERIKPGMTEIQIAAAIEGFMRAKGAQKTSFDTIVASGARSAMVHATASQKQVEAGDFIIMDFGCVFEGYCSDLTRTVVLSHASDEQRELYSLVLTAQERALNSILPYMPARDLDALARDVFEKAGRVGFFQHGLGHGVGVNVHEKPTVSPLSEDELSPGSVITVEPGLYIEGLGGVRIEDMVLVGATENEILTKAQKELIVID